jgi:hypothetical protein
MMLVRTIATLAVLALLGNSLTAQEHTTSLCVGDHLVIEMTGDVAKEYARRCGDASSASLEGLHISTTATIAQKLDDGRIRIEHFSNIKREGNQARLVTLTGTVESAKITIDVTPKGTPVYASPIDQKNHKKPTLTTQDTQTPRLQLSNLKGLKLRTWTLAEETGD